MGVGGGGGGRQSALVYFGKMKNFARLILTILVVATLTSGVMGQVETVEIVKIQVVKAIAGVVLDPNGDAIAGASVSETSLVTKAVVRSTTTDGKGNFKMAPTPGQKTYHLIISAKGFNPLLVHVKTSRWTRKLLSLRLEVAT